MQCNTPVYTALCADEHASARTLTSVNFNHIGPVQAMPWILDVGYTVLLVALLTAFMGHILFGDFEYTMNTLPASISGLRQASSLSVKQATTARS